MRLLPPLYWLLSGFGSGVGVRSQQYIVQQENRTLPLEPCRMSLSMLALCADVCARMWRSADNFGDSILSFPCSFWGWNPGHQADEVSAFTH